MTNLTEEQFNIIKKNPLYKPIFEANILHYVAGLGSLKEPTPCTLESHVFTCNPILLQDLEVIEGMPYVELLNTLAQNPGHLTNLVSNEIHTKYRVSKQGTSAPEPILSSTELTSLFKNIGNVLYLKSHYLSNVLYNFFSLGI